MGIEDIDLIALNMMLVLSTLRRGRCAKTHGGRRTHSQLIADPVAGDQAWRHAVTADVLVVVPTLGKRERLLEASLRSIRRNGPGVALVVVAPEERCEAIEPIVLRTGGHLLPQTGSGQSAAINQGWAERPGAHEFITWLGDDDLLEPGSLARSIRALNQKPNASMVVGTVRYIDLDDRQLFLFRPPLLYGARLMRFGGNLMSQPGSVLRADAVDAAGPLDEDLRFAMDLDLFLRLAQQGPILRVPDVVASFRWHPDSLTAGQGEASEREAEAVRRRYWTHPRRDRMLGWAAKGVTRLQYWSAKR